MGVSLSFGGSNIPSVCRDVTDFSPDTWIPTSARIYASTHLDARNSPRHQDVAPVWGETLAERWGRTERGTAIAGEHGTRLRRA